MFKEAVQSSFKKASAVLLAHKEALLKDTRSLLGVQELHKDSTKPDLKERLNKIK